MAPLTEQETTLVHWLASQDRAEPLALAALWESLFLTKAEGRTMIMQTQDRFAMFYLLGLKHSDPAVLHENLTSLTQMMGFIIFLERERYMTIYRSHFTTDLNFHYLGEVIGNPHIDHKKLILNDEGLYSLEPGMIMNKQDECVYLGTKLQGVSYDLAYQTMVGGLVIHPSIKDLCETMG